MVNSNNPELTLAVIPGTLFMPYLYALSGVLKAKGVNIKVVAPFRFHLAEAKQAGIPLLHPDIDDLISASSEESLSDELIDEDTLAFRRMFNYEPSYRELYRKLVFWYRKLFREGGVNALLIFNGFKIYQRAAIRAADMDSIRVIHIENGYLPRTLQIDPSGINFKNSLVERYLSRRDDITPSTYEELRSFARDSVCTDVLPGAASRNSSRGPRWMWGIFQDLIVDPLAQAMDLAAEIVRTLERETPRDRYL